MSTETRIKILKEIWDYGEDHHPPYICAKAGEIVVVRSTNPSGSLNVSHENVHNSTFIVYAGEYEVVV